MNSRGSVGISMATGHMGKNVTDKDVLVPPPHAELVNDNDCAGGGDSADMDTGEIDQCSRINLWIPHLQQMDLSGSKISN